MDYGRKYFETKIIIGRKNPTLLLGAGFSYGAINEDGDALPLGGKLVEKLYQHMFVDNPPCKTIMDEDGDGALQYKSNGDLKGLCSLLREEGRADDRDAYLTTMFTGASIDEKSKVFNIVNYRWNKIFTLNIDCLLEYIFEKKGIPYKVWNRDNDDCFARDFGDSYSKGDVIFIGTEFQEDDLKTIINKYSSKGYDLSGNNYFFISPKINNILLKRQISSADNYYWIPWTTEKFFEFLYKDVISEKDVKKSYRKKG